MALTENYMFPIPAQVIEVKSLSQTDLSYALQTAMEGRVKTRPESEWQGLLSIRHRDYDGGEFAISSYVIRGLESPEKRMYYAVLNLEGVQRTEGGLEAVFHPKIAIPERL